jgi:hypothetical protein
MKISSHKRVLGTIAAGLALSAAIASPARAEVTNTTFEITSAGISVTPPASADLGSVTTADSISTALGSVTVADGRGTLLGTWAASVESSDFTTGDETANETIGKANVSYWSGAATASSGTAVRVPGQLLAANAQALSASRTAFSATGTLGTNSTTWNPTIVVAVPAAAVAGTYSGTITHSVA